MPWAAFRRSHLRCITGSEVRRDDGDLAAKGGPFEYALRTDVERLIVVSGQKKRSIPVATILRVGNRIQSRQAAELHDSANAIHDLDRIPPSPPQRCITRRRDMRLTSGAD